MIKWNFHFVALVAKSNVRYPIDVLIFYFVVLSRIEHFVTYWPDDFSWLLIDAHCDFVVSLKSLSCFFFCDGAGSASSVTAVSHHIELIGDVRGAFEFWVDEPKATSVLHFVELDCEWIAARNSNSSKQVNVEAIGCHDFVLNGSLLESMRLMIQKLIGRLWERFWDFLILHKSFITLKSS